MNDEKNMKDKFIVDKKEKLNKGKFLITILGTTLGVYFIMKFILPLVVPFLFAYLIASVLLPLIRLLERKFRIPKTLSSGILLVVLFTLLGSGLYLLLKNLIHQIITLLSNIPVYQASAMKFIDSFCIRCDGWFHLIDGQAKGFVDANLNTIMLEVRNKIIPSMTGQTITIALKILGLSGVIIFLVVSSMLMIRDADEIKNKFMSTIIYDDILIIRKKISRAGIAYFKAQLIIMSIISIINVTGLFIIKNRYALLIGIVIAIIDAFPVLGSGTILIPWVIISLFSKDVLSAAILMSMYMICQVIRQFLEPKLIGDKIGINPIFTIMSIYAGIQLFGIWGFFLGPVSLVMIKAIVEVVNYS